MVVISGSAAVGVWKCVMAAWLKVRSRSSTYSRTLCNAGFLLGQCLGCLS